MGVAVAAIRLVGRKECLVWAGRALGALIVMVAAVTKPAAALEPVCPGATWTTAQPRQVGMDAAKLRQFSSYVGGRGCVVRTGRMVHTWGNQSLRFMVASASKPLFTHFLFKAVELGMLQSLEDLVYLSEPRLYDLNADLGSKDRGICWRHLACQISCYGVTEPPETAFDYSDFSMALFYDTLFLNVYQTTWTTVDDQVLRPMLTDLLQCQDRPSLRDPTFPGLLAISVRDFARFGLLYLRQGNWNGQWLILPEHVTTAVTSPVPDSIPRTGGVPAEMIDGQRSIGGGRNQTGHYGSYSYAWWINGIRPDGRRHWPDAPPDAFGAFGHGGSRAMVVIPSLDLVTSWNDTRLAGWDTVNQALKLLVASLTS